MHQRGSSDAKETRSGREQQCDGRRDLCLRPTLAEHRAEHEHVAASSAVDADSRIHCLAVRCEG